jgi:hypothetical protein
MTAALNYGSSNVENKKKFERCIAFKIEDLAGFV